MWLAYRLGAELFSVPVGVVTALVVLTRPALERDALLGYQDTAFAVLIVWAVLLEARRSRRGVPVLVLLAVAGLMRPEAWALAGLYTLYMWRGAAPRSARAYSALTAARAGPVGARRTGRSPATRCTRCTAPPTSPRPSTAAATR